MSVQFGQCNFDGKPFNVRDLDKVRAVLAPYGPDGERCACKDNFGIVYRAFHTTTESRREIQPHFSPYGFVLTWDGRLDNREELISQLAAAISHDPTDLEIVAKAYQRWGAGALAKLIGDWTLSVWNAGDQSLLLATDFVGTRHLYYSVEKDQVTWCTILDPLVLFAGHGWKLEEEYIAGWLALFPAAHLTPYVGIYAVPPSSFVRFTKGVQRISKYWDFDPSNRIRYRSDAEYEEHFRAIFSESVRRRLRADRPILAELSGGMDSSSIVCMADEIIAKAGEEKISLETISYYDDREPNWNERPYFEKVEQKRGRIGHHIELGTQPRVVEERSEFGVTPAAGRSADDAFSLCLASTGSRVVLSGIGGDEVTGGVPTPLPEFEDLLVTARFGRLAHQLKVWALNKRVPWFHLFFEAMRRFLPLALAGIPTHKAPAPWLNSGFVNRNRNALQGYEKRLSVFGFLPTFQENLQTLDGLRRQLACDPLPLNPCERRYPYLDRSLLEFVYAVPREQIVRPGQRRSLMRRALAGIVPDEILNRRRKAYVSRSPMIAVAQLCSLIKEMNHAMISSELGFIDQNMFSLTLHKACNGQEVPLVILMRTFATENWLRSRVDRTSSNDLMGP